MPHARLSTRLLLLSAAVALASALLLVLLWNGISPADAQGDGSERPAKPTGLEVDTTAGSLDVSMDWDDVDGATDYLVRWRFHGPDQELNEGVMPTSSDADITVAAYGRWVVRVQACNDGGCGPAMAQTLSVAPGQPSNLAVNTGSSALDLSVSWKAVAGADGYNVRWRRADGNFAPANLVDTAATSASITVADYGRWWVRVDACKGEVCGPGAIHVVDTPPGPPANLTVASSTGELSVTTTWDATADATSYQLRWKRPSGEFEAGNEMVAAAASATITVSGYGEWEVTLQACNHAGCGPDTSRVARVVPHLPGQVSGLTAAVDAAGSSVVLSWHAPTDGGAATGYRILRRVASAGSSFLTLVDDTGNTDTAYTDTTVAVGAGYIYRVQAVNFAGAGERSGTAEVFFTDKPGRPSNLSAELDALASYQDSGHSVTLTWEAPAGGASATGYQILRREATDTSSLAALVADTDTTYQDASVVAGKSYIYRVQARNAAGVGAESGSVQVAVPDYHIGRSIKYGAIPAIDNPTFVKASQAIHYDADDYVVGVSINGDTRAYAIPQIYAREVVNDTVGGTPVIVTYCWICQTVIVFERTIDGTVHDFGASGGLMDRTNSATESPCLVMYDRQTKTLWSQVLGLGVRGEQNGVQLQTVPATFTTWGEWKKAHPTTKAMGLTGHSPGDNPTVSTADPKDDANAAVAAAPVGDKRIAYPFSRIMGDSVRNVEFNGVNLLVFYDTGSKTALIFDRKVDNRTLSFRHHSDSGGGTMLVDRQTDSKWNAFTGVATAGQLKGRQLARIHSHPIFWKTWQNYYPDSRVYAAPVRLASPTRLQVSNGTGPLDVSATWDAATGADAYRVRWRALTGDFESANLVETTGTSASFTVADYGRWRVRVEACEAGTCGWGAIGAVDVPPGQPQNLAVSGGSSPLDLSVTWDAVTGADSYQVRWRTPTGAFETANLVDTAATSASITVADHGRWWVRVWACKGTICGPRATRVVDIAAPAKSELNLAPALDTAGKVRPRTFTAIVGRGGGSGLPYLALAQDRGEQFPG